MKAALIDMDGTLAIFNGRSWEEYDRCDTDLPCESVRALITGLKISGVEPIIVTGRPITYWDQTRRWLDDNIPVTIQRLFMRPEGDNTSNAAYKKRTVEALVRLGYEIVLAVDDYDKTARMYQELGIPTLYVIRQTSSPFLVTEEDRQHIAIATSIDNTYPKHRVFESRSHLRKRAGMPPFEPPVEEMCRECGNSGENPITGARCSSCDN